MTEAASSKPRVAFGPRFPGAGSWEWLGEDMAQALKGSLETVVFDREVPDCDVVVFIKYKPSAEMLREIGQRAAIVYCPVDVYGSAAEIDADPGLLLCDRVIVHCPKLGKYTRSYAPTICLDHHWKFATPVRQEFLTDGPLLWVGVRTNLPPVAKFLSEQRWQDEIWILTNPEHPDDLEFPQRLGLPTGLTFRFEEWTAARHLEWLTQSRAVFDVKGEDFRSRHKPAAKAMDMVASGVPLAINSQSSPAESLRRLGFEVASLEDRKRWLSQEYWEQTVSFAQQIRERNSLTNLTTAWETLIQEVLIERDSQPIFLPLEKPPSAETPIDREEPPTPIPTRSPKRTRVAILSMLFNWPSTGGGTIHTFETARFLSRAGYVVRHFYVQSEAWQVGNVEQPPDYPAEPIFWEPSEQGLAALQSQIREVMDIFAPDFVILTDSWTMKPRLAEAVKDTKFFLRLAAQECLCPLNNVRMLVDQAGHITRCPRHQLATPDVCRKCVATRQGLSGTLHQRERELAGYGSADYERVHQWAFSQAEAVLVVNPLIEAMVSPFAKRVCVVPSGFDAARFPWPWPENPETKPNARTVILFAGLPQELMKGFFVIQAACERLWSVRQDFELWITDDPPGPRNDFTRAIGWQSQSDLPHTLRQSDIVVFPTVAEEALGRTAVEAMAVGRPVVASRIGGLSWTIPDGGTGLLFEPGNAVDLAEKLTRLLDDPALRDQLGQNGRQRFESQYTWEGILSKHYRPLLGDPVTI